MEHFCFPCDTWSGQVMDHTRTTDIGQKESVKAF